MVHKAFEDDDPMELIGVALPGGDMEVAAENMVEEFVRMGLQDAELLYLFKDPFFAGTHRIYQIKGEEYVVALIERVRRKWSVPRASNARERREMP